MGGAKLLIDVVEPVDHFRLKVSDVLDERAKAFVSRRRGVRYQCRKRSQRHWLSC